MYFHQIFVDIGKGKTYKDNPIYLEFVEENKQRHRYLHHKIWNEEMLDKLVEDHYPDLLYFWNDFPHKFWKIDFGRYLILAKEGGIYCDMDDVIIEPIIFFQKDILTTFIRESTGKREFGNNIIYFKDSNRYLELIDFCLERNRNCKMPSDWKERRFFHIVGQRCFNSFLKDEKKVNRIMYKTQSTLAWKNY